MFPPGMTRLRQLTKPTVKVNRLKPMSSQWALPSQVPVVQLAGQAVQPAVEPIDLGYREQSPRIRTSDNNVRCIHLDAVFLITSVLISPVRRIPGPFFKCSAIALLACQKRYSGASPLFFLCHDDLLRREVCDSKSGLS